MSSLAAAPLILLSRQLLDRVGEVGSRLLNAGEDEGSLSPGLRLVRAESEAGRALRAAFARGEATLYAELRVAGFPFYVAAPSGQANLQARDHR
jgi:hypothetical protein